MVLQGLGTATYVGWLSGVLFQKSPKGFPVFPARKSIYTLYALTVFLIMTGIWMDFHIKHLQILKSESKVDTFLGCSLLFGATIFDIYFRACFFTRAKLIARFLKLLETDIQKLPVLQISQFDRNTWKSYLKVVSFVKLYHFTGALLLAFWVSTLIPLTTYKILGIISNEMYPIIFLFIGSIPLISSAYVAFAVVIVTTFHIMWMFDDFCITFDELIISYEHQVSNSVKRNLGEIYSMPASKQNSSNSQLLNKFEHLRQLCSQYDKIVGPLLLGLLVRAVFVLISAANSILLYDGKSTPRRVQLFLNVYHFVMELTQLFLLQLGYIVHRRLAERKEELHRKVILMANLGRRDELMEVAYIINEWNWSVSGGPGFFHVDRPLLSGVVSSLMTYVTIIFQLNVVDDLKQLPDFMNSWNSTSTASYNDTDLEMF